MAAQLSGALQGPTSNSHKKLGSFKGQHVCTASLALTMLLMLKRFLKATYSMSEERISAFQPDIPDKRKQVSDGWLLLGTHG